MLSASEDIETFLAELFQPSIENSILNPHLVVLEILYLKIFSLTLRLVDNVMLHAVPITKKILLQEAVIEERLHMAVDGHKDTLADFRS